MAIIFPSPLTYARQRPITASHSSRYDMLAIISSRYQYGPFLFFVAEVISNYLTTDGLKKISLLPEAPWGLRPVAFATSATWLIRHWRPERLCLCVCYESVLWRNGWTDRTGFWQRSFFRLNLRWVLRKFGLSKITVLSSGSLPHTLESEKNRHCMSTVASVVNLVRPTTVVSLSQWESIFVYNTMGVARVNLWQLRLVLH